MSVDHNKAEALFDAALRFKPEERVAFLASACGEDAALRRQVEELIEAVGAAGAFLPADPGTITVQSPAAGETVGTIIGRYRLLEALGEGGFGVVWLAEQKEPVRRKVALKVIKLGMDTKQVVARFEAERQALALMDHPNIAKVFDAGTTESGRPYFVMELVRGIPITRFCDENHLATDGRLDLFMKVCHAVQHAHQKGIIHRDLKPSNVLVTLHDGVPVPKIIDFGIAKATQQELTDKTIHTLFQQFIGTPAYVSPEQAEMSGLDIDTRSDIYALGVLLYELLTGKTPFDAKELLASGLDEMRRTIREQEPVRPSTRLNTLQGEELTTTAKRRGTEPPKLIHLVQGDLDWIVMRCLEKDRTRRYETANGLAQDIARHLGHEPVSACPPSASYRVQKFVRRNKVMVGAGAAVITALVLGVAASSWQALRASRLRVKAEANEQKAAQAQANEEKQRAVAEGERDRARLEAYAADLYIANTAWREGNLGQALSALRRQIPKPGETDLRGIEWRYLWRKCQSQELRTFRHEAEVTSAELSPDGRWLATASGGCFWVWDTTWPGEPRALNSGASGNIDLELEHLAFDPQGRFLATATRSEVLIWNVTDWRQQLSLQVTNASLCFSGDGALLATYGEDGIQIRKTATWEPWVKLGAVMTTSSGLRQFYGTDHRRIALNRDGSLLAVSWEDTWRHESSPTGEVRLWKLPHGQPVPLFDGSEVKDAIRLAFSDDDQWLAAYTWGPPAMVWLWSMPEGKLAARWPASQGRGRALAFAPGGQVLATAGSDQVISLWATAPTHRPQGRLQGHLKGVGSLKFAADGRLVSAADDQTARLWNISPDRSDLPSFPLPAGRLICPPTVDVRRMVTVNLTNLTFEEWDVESGQCVRQTSLQGADAILRHGTLFTEEPLENGLIKWSAVMDNKNVKPGDDRVWLLWHPLGAPAWDLGATTGDGRVYAWNAQSGALIYSNQVAASVLAAYPMADLRKLVLLKPGRDAPYVNGPLYSYDLQTHQTELIDAQKFLTIPQASPDGRRIAYVTTNDQVKVWDAATQQTQLTVTLPEANASSLALGFSPDSRLLAVARTEGEGWARVFDVSSGQPVSDPLAGYSAGVYKIGFSADSKSLVTYEKDGTAKIWNVATGREMVSRLPVNQFLTYHWYWTVLPPDGNSVVEGVGEDAIRVVRLPTLAEIDALEKGQMKSP